MARYDVAFRQPLDCRFMNALLRLNVWLTIQAGLLPHPLAHRIAETLGALWVSRFKSKRRLKILALRPAAEDGR